MSDQEAEMNNNTYLDDTGEDGGLESSGLAMLRLNPPVSSCRECGGSMKRRSPSSSSSSLQEPKSKKISRHPSSTLIVGDHLLQGFTKLHLPIPTLHRCVSDPINSPGTTNNNKNNNPTNANGFFNPLSSQNAKTPSPPPPPPPPNAKPTSSASATLRRSLSDPIPTPTPPPDSIQCLTPNSKRLKRMRDRMKEMSQWWDEVMEGEKERGSEDDNNNGAPEKDESETTECEEAVSVERSGKWLIVHIKCSCGKGYQILLYGNICYYKLM